MFIAAGFGAIALFLLLLQLRKAKRGLSAANNA
jgi:hypothetical protein